MAHLPKIIREKLNKGVVIPAHPLALNEVRKLDERRQRALTRYYLSAGAGGIAIGVHTTQFEIRDPRFGLFKPVLQITAETISEMEQTPGRYFVRIAGIAGRTPQAVAEAQFAAGQGYHAGLLSLGALQNAGVEDLVRHCKTVGEIIPLIGFYLQPAVGGRILPFEFWRSFLEIEAVVAIKIAPFNRYYTLDVLRAVAESGRAGEIALYTGNDDHIVGDLITPFRFTANGTAVTLRMVGGLLGHWAVWTRKAVELLDEIHTIVSANRRIPAELLTRAVQITDANAAFFDPQHNF
ncbi:MAG TPA: dihydrodipicolinate synthase family protein, partial [Bacteroidetes bacterium]|nr:dihydrodipicolinate synthase family protein [Bacteroidota bacterium]